MSNNLNIFRKDFLKTNSWVQRKDGVPLGLLDNLTSDELKVAEAELIKSAKLTDDWPIIGLGYIKSKSALPVLYDLLPKSAQSLKVTIAHSIFQICQDSKMIDVALEEMPKISSQYDLIDVLYLLPDFKDARIVALLNEFRNHKEYLVAYNATRALKRSTKNLVEKYRNQENK